MQLMANEYILLKEKNSKINAQLKQVLALLEKFERENTDLKIEMRKMRK